MIASILLAVLAWSRPAVDYTREVKPVLAARCTSCHGAIRQKAGLRLDTAELIRRGGDSGPAIETGHSDESLLIERVTAAERAERMPPESEGTPLSPAEVATLRAWIDQGAHAPPEPTPADPRRHWAFQPPARPAIPRATNPARARNPIDAFLDAAHRARGLKPAPPVGKDLWLRRVSLDLIGLPPTRHDIHAFRDDDTPDAEEKVVDRLLGSPRHGERWARHWMDVWRYSDWYGLGQEPRYSHPHLWHWRDWIVGSINADTGYDRMVIEMLAGDELAPDDPDTVRATGFLARNWDIFNRNVWLASTVEHTSRAFLGLTIQCARCHDHKFDPISQADYYRFRAFFEPYHIRVDRVPGESDRVKAGLPRAFDDFLDRPTFLFLRGEESRPDASRPLRPAVPAVLGGEVRIEPIPLPLAASCPDKRPFVIDEVEAEADRSVVRAKTDVDEARRLCKQAEGALTAARDVDAKAAANFATAAGQPDRLVAARAAAIGAVESLARARQADDRAREDRDVAESALTLAEAKRAALRAVVAAERLEDEGAKTSKSASWAEAARTATAAQRAQGLAEANHNCLRARRDTARAQRTLDGLLIAATVRDDATSKDARAKAATSLVEARALRAEAEKHLALAESIAKTPTTTHYVPRPLEFPRAKTTYRDTPSNAPYAKVSTGRRLALARWIVDRRNPLAARVAVNHVWARHFGEPLISSMSDFGLRAARPELIDLLDWLAVDLMESGWSLKHLHRRIVTSRAYRMRSSDARPDDTNLRIDPDNRYAWRMNPRRMEGEVIRDSLLLLAGRLDPTMGGPDLPIEFAEAGRRRTLYYRVARDERIPLLTAFDAPNVEDCYRRHETIVPQQALAMINSAMVLTRAGQVAAAIDREVGGDSSASARAAFVVAAFEEILGRTPSGAEQSECEAGLARLAGAFAAEGSGTTPDRTPEARARSALVHVLLNHNDFITIR
jgi:hypothetical protein